MIRQLVIDTIKENIMDRYCEFSGTISRRVFWKFMLVEHLLFGFIIAVLGLLSENSALYVYMVAIAFAVWVVAFMALTLPNLGAMVCRLRDTNTSEWLLLLAFIPYIGILIVIILLLRDSKSPSVASASPNLLESNLEMDQFSNTYESVLNIDAEEVQDTPKSYGKQSIILATLITILFWSIGLYSFHSATHKEIKAYLRMEPGAFMILAAKTLDSDTAVDSAKQVMTEYYTYLNKEQYQAAYRLLAHRERERYGTYDQWVKSVKASHSREMRRIFLDGVYVDDDGFKHIYFDMAFKGEEYPRRMAVYMVYEHETWRIESIAPYHKE